MFDYQHNINLYFLVMEHSENQEIKLSKSQSDLLLGVCTFYGFRQYTFFVFTRKSIIKALDAMIGELEFKLLNSDLRYHSVLVTDIDALRCLYAQIV